MRSDIDIKKFKTLDSTNHYASALVRESRPPEGTVVIAEEQTEGKGMEESTWESEAGKNLTFSVILYPDFLNPSRQFFLNIITSLAARDMVKILVPEGDIRIKWPNDIYYHHKKLGGILIKNQVSGPMLQSSIIGVGLNLNQENFFSDAPNPVSVKMITGKSNDVLTSLKIFREIFDEYYRRLGYGEYDQLLREYIQGMYRFGEELEYIIMGHHVVGTISGIDEFGRLLVSTSDSVIPCQVKEIKFPLAPPA
ncbi:MAG: biotin--[acetyl-CoA-carboxylase] ligase [Bacteroidia bacterium]|nr:biotin--[acetyl-CoA-carboxylase] ligase [Bacteroidales bacterium]NCD41810.1 biotin--[acetyl-CoA-carboxylase] ligase [Bacteroidia bacterium]MDD2322226.1 biotin--[acetyl-CoA-carboxylase] ligase [Bacteroidales bacterium]MDD3009786.1 biotin--[acetyl-CoA-carboxylase] ligase [Bacteroidales bacterium]MDD3960296.1 biotin--[acetyl-CoA-carboxylase] ligase [Bacteroidales bacterium]